MDVYAGVMYTCTNQILDEDDNFTVYLYSKGQGTWGWDYANAYWTCFIPVMDGYYAFVDVKYGASYNFTGLGLYHEENGWYAKISDQLLVDPAKDDNGLAPKSIDTAVRFAKERFDQAVREVIPTGNAKTDIRKIIDRYNQKTVKDYFQPVGKMMPRDAKPANVKVNVKKTTKAASQQEKPAFKLGPVAFSNTSRLN